MINITERFFKILKAAIPDSAARQIGIRVTEGDIQGIERFDLGGTKLLEPKTIDTPEEFWFDNRPGYWDVTTAKRMVCNRHPNYVIDVNRCYEAFFESEHPREIFTERALNGNLDLEVPLIGIKEPRDGKADSWTFQLIDGHHRLYRAKHVGRRWLACHVLEIYESDSIHKC